LSLFTVASRSQDPTFRPTNEIRPTQASAVHLVSENKRNLAIEEVSDQS
jgi:hypothetical protein